MRIGTAIILLTVCPVLVTLVVVVLTMYVQSQRLSVTVAHTVHSAATAGVKNRRTPGAFAPALKRATLKELNRGPLSVATDLLAKMQ